jgi:hypothetical protein
MEALVKTKSVQLRGLAWSDRRQAIKGSMATGAAAVVKDRCVLLVDFRVNPPREFLSRS